MLNELNALRQEFRSLPDAFSRYAYLMELSALLPDDHPALHDDINRYSGCQSSVWLLPLVERGVVRLYADSDSILLRGMLYLYAAILGGETPEDARAAHFELLKELGLEEHFEAERTAGVSGLLTEIQNRLTA